MQPQYCSHCGQPIAPNANFCAYCGARHHSVHPPNAQPQPPALVQPQQASVQTHVQPQPAAVPAMPQAEAPNDDDLVPRRHLAPRAKLLFFVNYVVLAAVLLPFMIAFIFFDPLFAGALLLAYFTFCYLAALISYNNFYFSIDQNGFEKDFGVFFKKHVSIPYEQIQNVNTTRTILDRTIGIARLDIETAGSASHKKREIVGGIRSMSEGHLPGISATDARRFHDILLRKSADHHQSKETEKYIVETRS